MPDPIESIVSIFEDRQPLILAPMVRYCNIPCRLIYQRWGADITFTEAIVAQKIIRSTMLYNIDTSSYSLFDKKGTKYLTKSAEERAVVLQMSVSDPLLAVEAYQKVQVMFENVDINCGCPAAFSTHSGGGGCLMDNVEAIEAIVLALRPHVKGSLSCKIRVLPDPEKMREFTERICSTGIDFLSVHARFPGDPRSTPVELDLFKVCLEVARLSGVPCVYNGSITDVESFNSIKETVEADGYMIARGAMYDMAVFHKIKHQGNNDKVPTLCDLFKMHYDSTVRFGNHTKNLKRVVQSS
ncbi:hypothetical protein PCE1_000473, partial [Barthelona sp. PCE]